LNQELLKPSPEGYLFTERDGRWDGVAEHLAENIRSGHPYERSPRFFWVATNNGIVRIARNELSRSLQASGVLCLRSNAGPRFTRPKPSWRS